MVNQDYCGPGRVAWEEQVQITGMQVHNVDRSYRTKQRKTFMYTYMSSVGTARLATEHPTQNHA